MNKIQPLFDSFTRWVARDPASTTEAYGGTLYIVRRLFIHAQGQASPLFRVENKFAVTGMVSINLLVSIAVLVLVLAGPAIVCIEGVFNVNLLGVADTFLAGFLLFCAGGLSLGWTLPLTLLAGTPIAREREKGTWETLLMLPMPRGELLLIKGAAGVRTVWTFVLGCAALAIMIGGLMIAPVIGSMAYEINNSLLIGILLATVSVPIMIAERLQEIALALTVGLAIPGYVRSRQLVTLLGFLAGAAIRLAQVVLIVSFIPRDTLLSVDNLTAIAVVSGSPALMAAIPGAIALALSLIFLIGREYLIRALFRWVAVTTG